MAHIKNAVLWQVPILNIPSPGLFNVNLLDIAFDFLQALLLKVFYKATLFLSAEFTKITLKAYRRQHNFIFTKLEFVKQVMYLGKVNDIGQGRPV